MERLTSTLAVNDAPTLLLALLGRRRALLNMAPDAGPACVELGGTTFRPSEPYNRRLIFVTEGGLRDQADSGCLLAADPFGISWRSETNDDFRLYRQFQKG